jgi:hypothetical protein
MISPQSLSSLLSLINLTKLPPAKITTGQLFQHFAEDRLRNLLSRKIQQSSFKASSKKTIGLFP